MRKGFCIAAAALLMATTACRKEPTTPVEVAEACYQALIEERWDDYVSTTANADSLSDELRQERIDIVREYMDFERQAHGGLVSVRALRDTLVADDYAYVFLQMNWADSTSEEVMLPLIMTNGKWKVR